MAAAAPRDPRVVERERDEARRAAALSARIAREAAQVRTYAREAEEERRRRVLTGRSVPRRNGAVAAATTTTTAGGWHGAAHAAVLEDTRRRPSASRSMTTSVLTAPPSSPADDEREGQRPANGEAGTSHVIETNDSNYWAQISRQSLQRKREEREAAESLRAAGLSRSSSSPTGGEHVPAGTFARKHHRTDRRGSERSYSVPVSTHLVAREKNGEGAVTAVGEGQGEEYGLSGGGGGNVEGAGDATVRFHWPRRRTVLKCAAAVYLCQVVLRGAVRCGML